MRMILTALLLVAAPAMAKDRQKAAPDPMPVASSIDGLPIGAIPRQALPAKGCAAYLWTMTPSHALAAMAVADPAAVRLNIDGQVRDFARTAQTGAGGYGFAASATYQGGDVTAVLDMTIATRADLPGGASVPSATLRIDRTGKDTIVLPLGGLIGCAG